MKTLVATWYTKDGCYGEARAALQALAKQVHAEEPGTWGYLIHSGLTGSLPPTSKNTIVFVEMYKDDAAFMKHIDGPAFQGFVKTHGHLFESMPPDGPSYYQACNLERLDGFVRKEATGGG